LNNVELATSESPYWPNPKSGNSTLQIAWKQRFFVPLEEERGNAVIAALLEQFPVIATDDEEADCHLPSDAVMPSANETQPVDLEKWLIEPPEVQSSSAVADQGATAMTETDPTSDESKPTCTHLSQSTSLPIARQASAAAMLLTQPPDYRTATIQIGFNFAESESI
jgi:cell pole-organizing protein PopZ